jgi:hypothetical protein
LDGLLDRLAPVLSDTFNIEVFWFHNVLLVLGFRARRENLWGYAFCGVGATGSYRVAPN